IGDVEASGSVERKSSGRMQRAACGWAKVSGISGSAVAGDRGDHMSGGVYTSNDVLAEIGNEKIALKVHGDSCRLLKFSGCRCTAIAGVAERAVARDRCD